jgi:septal ring factor EnvC (AmiA/AmiB activator)
MMTYIKGLMAVAVFGALFGGYVYVKDLRTELDLRIEKQAKQQVLIEGLNSSIGLIKTSLQASSNRLKEIESGRKKSKKRLDVLEDTIGKHDIAKIRQRKPELLRRVYERGTNKYYGDVRNAMEN